MGGGKWILATRARKTPLFFLFLFFRYSYTDHLKCQTTWQIDFFSIVNVRNSKYVLNVVGNNRRRVPFDSRGASLARCIERKHEFNPRETSYPPQSCVPPSLSVIAAPKGQIVVIYALISRDRFSTPMCSIQLPLQRAYWRATSTSSMVLYPTSFYILVQTHLNDTQNAAQNVFQKKNLFVSMCAHIIHQNAHIRWCTPMFYFSKLALKLFFVDKSPTTRDS